MKKLILLIGVLMILSSFSVFAIVGHPASQVFPGLFATGNYNFNGNLDVNGTATINNLFQVDAADGVRDNGYAQFIYNRESTPGRSYGLYIAAGNTTTDNALNILNFDESNNLFVVKGSGDVGIGTASPGATLEVDSDSAIGDVLRIQRGVNPVTTLGDNTDMDIIYASAGGGGLGQIGFRYTARQYAAAVIGFNETDFSGQTKGSLIFATSSSTSGSVAPDVRMEITSGGSVKINTLAGGGTCMVCVTNAGVLFTDCDGTFDCI